MSRINVGINVIQVVCVAVMIMLQTCSLKKMTQYEVFWKRLLPVTTLKQTQTIFRSVKRMKTLIKVKVKVKFTL